MSFDDDLRAVLREHSGRALDAGPARSALYEAIDRRQRYRHAGAVAGATLAVVALGIGMQALQPQGSGTVTQAQPAARSSNPSTAAAQSPVGPSSPRPAPWSDARTAFPEAQDAFFAAGYTLTDADAIATAWNVDDAYGLKAFLGEMIHSGETLPVAPGAPVNRDSLATLKQSYDRGLAEFRQTYSDQQAWQLAAIWNAESAEGAAAFAGQLLLDGQQLPPVDPTSVVLPPEAVSTQPEADSAPLPAADPAPAAS